MRYIYTVQDPIHGPLAFSTIDALCKHLFVNKGFGEYGMLKHSFAHGFGNMIEQGSFATRREVKTLLKKDGSNLELYWGEHWRMDKQTILIQSVPLYITQDIVADFYHRLKEESE